MTHNKYFFTGRMEEARKRPDGGNVAQDFVHPSDPVGPHQADVLPLIAATDHHGRETYNMNPMLLESIRLSDYFWEIAKYTTFSEVIDQIYYNIQYVTPWLPGTHKAVRSVGMQSAMRGVSNAGSPGTAFTMLLKMYIMRLTRTQLDAMLSHQDSAFIRAMGLLYLRIGALPADGCKDLWSWFEPHLDDKEAFNIDGSATTATTVGQFCRRLLTDQDYFGDRLPRIPVLVQRQIDQHLRERDEAGGGSSGGRTRDAREATDSIGASWSKAGIDQKRVKTVLCRHFMFSGVCRHGAACSFAHGEAELNEGRSSYYNDLLHRERDGERDGGRDLGRDERADRERGGSCSSSWQGGWREQRDGGGGGGGAALKRRADEYERGTAPPPPPPPKQPRPEPSEQLRAKKEEMTRLEARCAELRAIIAEKEARGER